MLGEADLVERSRVDHGEAVRHRPGQRQGAQRHWCTRSSTRSRSSASTTSSARRRRRTSWPSASPTACSSRSGTATTSTTSRSTCPRRSSVDDRVAFYEATGAFKDMVVTHLFQILAFMAMEPPTALEPGAISEEKNKVFRSHAPARRRPRWCAASTRATATSRAWRPTRTPRPSSPCAARSTTGAGPACRSSCAPASGWAAASASSPSPSASRPRACSPRARAWARRARTTSPSTWPTRRSCRCRSTASGRDRA